MTNLENIVSAWATSLEASNPEWTPSFYELTQCIGQNALLVEYTRESKDDAWELKNKVVEVLSISNFNTKTGVYDLTWKDAETGEESVSPITPLGYSYTDSEEGLYSFRLLPIEYQFKFSRASEFWKRMLGMFESEDPGLTREELDFYKGTGKQSFDSIKTIVVVVRTTNPEKGIGRDLVIPIHQVINGFWIKKDKLYRHTFTDPQKRSYFLSWDLESGTVTALAGGRVLGTAKVFDLTK